MNNNDEWRKLDIHVMKRYAEAFNINYSMIERKLFSAFKEPFSDPIIHKRIRLLDSYYRTGLARKKLVGGATDMIIKKGKSFEDRIRGGDDAAVKEIARCKEFNCFVFATKYCSFLNTDFYPIYDSNVAKALNWYQSAKDQHFCNKRCLGLQNIRESGDYPKFKQIIDDFAEFYGLLDENGKPFYKAIDKFLWIVGKNME